MENLNINYRRFLTIAIAIIMIMIPGCQKAPINGDLDGQWQVMTVEPEAPETIITERMYYCFSLHTCQLSMYGSGIWASGNIVFNNNLLTLDFPDANSDLNIARLKQYGIYSNPVTFTIEHLDKNKLILRDGEVTISLRKF